MINTALKNTLLDGKIQYPASILMRSRLSKMTITIFTNSVKFKEITASGPYYTAVFFNLWVGTPLRLRNSVVGSQQLMEMKKLKNTGLEYIPPGEGQASDTHLSEP